MDDKIIYNKDFIVNFRNLAYDYLLNYDDQEIIDVDLSNVLNGKNFYERINNLAKIMCKNYYYLNDIMIQIIDEMLNIVIVVEVNYIKNNNNFEINYQYFGDKNNVWIDAIICLRLKSYENDNLNHFQAMIFAIDNANNRKGR